MKTLPLYLLLLITFTQCQKESENCHFFITIENNSNSEIIFGINFFSKGLINCRLDINLQKDIILPGETLKYRPYPYPDCIENAILASNKTLLYPIYIIDPSNYTTEAVPCEEFEERNTILRTYVLTLEDLERMDYTINYPEDASIGVD